MKAISPLAPLFFGLMVLYVGERAFADTGRWVLDAIGGVALVAALIIAALRARGSSPERKKALGRLLIEYGLVVAGVLLYFAQGDLLELIPAGDGRTAVQIVWPGLLLLGLLPAIAMEMALASMSRGRMELWRVKFAAHAARIIGLGIITFAGVNYAASQWNRKLDLSYFQTTRAGTANQAFIKELTQDVKFVLFFPPGNEVLEHARSYFDELVVDAGNAEVQILDQALNPDKARDYRVRNNGYVVIATKDRNETLRLGMTIESARGTLRNLDAEVQERLMKVLRPARIAYLTTGHLERDYAPPSDDKRLGLSDFRQVLESLGFTVKRLGLGEGLGSAVPDDASLLIVAGPIEPFQPAEVTAVRNYMKAGGRMLVFVDPDHGSGVEELISELGITASKELVATDDPRHLWRMEGRRETPYNVVTNKSSSHPSVKSLSRSAGRLAVLLMGAGSLAKTEHPAPELKIAFTLRSMAKTYIDANMNQRYDAEDEKRSTVDYAAAIEGSAKKNGQSPAPIDEEPKEEPEAKTRNRNRLGNRHRVRANAQRGNAADSGRNERGATPAGGDRRRR